MLFFIMCSCHIKYFSQATESAFLFVQCCMLMLHIFLLAIVETSKVQFDCLKMPICLFSCDKACGESNEGRQATVAIHQLKVTSGGLLSY